MARERNPKAQQMRARIAAAAARMMAEDGIDDFRYFRAYNGSFKFLMFAHAWEV